MRGDALSQDLRGASGVSEQRGREAGVAEPRARRVVADQVVLRVDVMARAVFAK